MREWEGCRVREIWIEGVGGKEGGKEGVRGKREWQRRREGVSVRKGGRVLVLSYNMQICLYLV